MTLRLTILPALVAVSLLSGKPLVVVRGQEPAQLAVSPQQPRDVSPVAAANAARCTVRQYPDGWWLTSPSGQPFFSLGVCVFDQGIRREAYDPSKPGYAAWRHYDAPEAWANSGLARLKSWGFTTIGGWSEYQSLPKSAGQDFWLTPVLHSGSTAGAPWFDMWDEKVLDRIEEVAKKTISPLRDNPRVLGYYSDNEIGWWNAILWNMTLQQPASSGQRQRLVRLVREAYNDDWNALARDFEPSQADTWEELGGVGKLWLRPGSDGIRIMRRFLAMVADRYYQLMRDVIRKFDPDALYLGDRYQSFYYPEVVQASRPYVDVVSTNLNASWNDGTFLQSYLDTLHSLSGRPVLVSEFYMAAEENRSGNKNSVGDFPQVGSQPERAKSLSNTLRALVRLPYVVGADWFQYYDEPPRGRELDGEDYNFGLVDIHDRPYAEVTASFSSLNLSKLKASSNSLRQNATHGVPRAPEDPFADFVPTRALKNWDRERSFVPPVTRNPTGDLYVCWNRAAIYLGLYVLDIIESDYYRSAEIPEIDRATWTINFADRQPLTVRIGAGIPPTASESALRIKSLSGIYNDVRCIAVVELSADRFGKTHFEPGDSIALDASLTTHARAHRIEWKGTLPLGN